MKKLSTLLTILVCFILFSTSAWSATWIVDNTGGGDFTTIQAAVNAASGNDIINVVGTGTNYTENVNIPGGKNQLSLIGVVGSGLPVLDGSGVANPKVAFRVSSDNVTIKNMVIQNYNFGGAINVDFGSGSRGVGIESLIASSGHDFSNNTINNCNWGIYVREGNSISITNNTITNNVATSHGSGYPNTGGAGIAVVSAGVSLDQNTIQNNTVTTSAHHGIFFGRTLAGGTPVGGDNVVINNNAITSSGGFGIYVNNIKPNDALRIENNVLNSNNAGLRLAQNAAANTDINVFDNEFNNTISTIEVQTDDLFSGGTLYDIMFNNGNRFDEGTPTITPGAIAALNVLVDEVVSNGTNRFIRNTFASAIVDGEGYLSAAAASTDVKVYAMAGFYPNEVALISNDPSNMQNMLITGEVNGGNLATAQGNAIGSTMFQINQLGNLTVTFQSINVAVNGTVAQIGINTESSYTSVLGCNFTSVVNSAGVFGVMAVSPFGIQQTGFVFEDNTINGFFEIGVGIDQDDFLISCNEFGTSNTGGDGIFVRDFNTDLIDIVGGRIIRNTSLDIAPSIAWNIRVLFPTMASGGLIVGEPDAGNFFNSGDRAVSVTQLADNQISVNYNSFLIDGYSFWIVSSGVFNLNAGWNYWELLTLDPNTEITAMLAGSGAGNISFLPIYTDGTDTDLAACGFQADLTSVWAPVYTAVNVGDPLTHPDALFFWTLEAALLDDNTGIGSVGGILDRYAVYMYNNATLTENNPLNIAYPMWIGGAPAQAANGNTAPDPAFWTVEAAVDAAPLFSIIEPGTALNPVAFDNFTLFPSDASASSDNNAIYIDIFGAPNTMSYLNVTNCIFDVADANQNSAIVVNSGTLFIDNFFIYNNTFMKNDAGYALVVNTGIQSTDIELLNNDILWNTAGTNPGFSIYFQDGVDGFVALGNKFEAGIALETDINVIDNVQIGAAGTHGLGFLQGNTFNNLSVSGMDYGVYFYSPIAGGMVAPTNISIVQNLFESITEAIFIDVEDAEIILPNVFINENHFVNIGSSAIVLDGVPPYTSGKIDATNNYWDTDDGPLALVTAPTWHESFPDPIIGNSYNYDANNNASPVGVLYEADFIQFVYWWQNFNANMGPGSFTGDQFAPFVNTNGDVYASLITALDETVSGDDIFITPGEFVESNTIQQPMIPYTVSIYGDVNGGTFFRPDQLNANATYANPFMFYFSGDVNISLYHLHLEDYRPIPVQDEDVFAGVFVDGNDGANTTIVRFYNGSMTGLDYGTDGTGFFAVGNADVRVENTVFTDNEFAGIWMEEDGFGTPIGAFINNTIDGGGITNYGIGLIGETYATIQYNHIFDNTGASAGIFSSGIGAGSLTIEFNEIYQNTHGIELGVGGAGDDYSAAIIRNNAIYDNTVAGLIYTPDAPSVVTAEDNFWGHDAGPASLGDLGLGDSQRNAYFDLGITQGNAIVDGNGDSEVDYLPYRLTLFTPNISMIAGPRFAPIIRTNTANIPLGFYANMISADDDVASGTDEGIYVYGGTYADLLLASNDEVRFIGKRRMAPYLATWLINPQGSAANAWDVANKGAHPMNDGPIFIAHNLGLPINAIILTVQDISIQGFVFDATDKTAGLDGPYTDNPDFSIFLFAAAGDQVLVNQNTFLADENDSSIDFSFGMATDWNISNNLFDASASAITDDPFAVNVVSGIAPHSDINIDNNAIIGGAVNIYAGSDDVSGIMVSFNEFTDSKAGVIASAVGGLGTQLANIYISNNIFFDYPTVDQFAFGIPDGTPDDAVMTSWTSDIMFIENYVGVDPLDGANTEPSVGFQSTDPNADYTSAITATCNWWGSINGPTYALNPGGDGATVSDRAYFAPWLSGPTNNATFGFDPADACDAGIRVWVNNTGNPADQFIIFPGLQMAVDDPTVMAGVNDFIFVHDDYTTGGTPGFLDETVTINWVSLYGPTLASESFVNEINLSGSLIFSDNSFDLYMDSPMRLQTDLIIDSPFSDGWLVLFDTDFTVEGHITERGNTSRVNTLGVGYLVKENVVQGGINNFPVANPYGGFEMPVQFVANSGAFNGSNNDILKVRVAAVDPVAAKGMGQNGFDVNALWSIDFVNATGANPDFSMQLRFPLGPVDANFDFITSYGAFWDMDPAATQWASKKSTSSWNGTDGIQVVNLNLESGRTDWSVFSGPTSFALSNEPNQARNIMWYTTTDRSIHFKWTKNDPNAQYYAILAREGTMITPPSAFTPTPISVYVPYTCPVLPNGPWTCSPGHLNFADGNVNSVDPNFDWDASLFHGDQTPNGARVIKIGQYGPGAIFDANVNNLKQGTFYEFFVANFNYGDGTTAVADMESGADGMANYNLNPNTLNPRTRKTMPAVYMTIDFNAGFATNVANQPNRVWAYSVPGVYNPMDIYNNIVKNNGVLGSYVVQNNYNGDNLLGGHVAEVCNDGFMSWTANNIRLHFRGYGNYTGSGWIIKYSENNDTKTFTTPSFASFTDRTRSANTDYYLVSAYDGDGKVAYKYDNVQTIRFQVDLPTDVTLTELPAVMPTCEGNNVTLVSAPNSYPNASFDRWEFNSGSGWTTFTTSLPGGSTATGGTSNTITLDYDDNGTNIRAVYISNSICDLGQEFNSNVITLQIYDATLTGTTPTPTAPYLCDDATSVVFTTTDGAPLTPPNTLVFLGWEISDDGGANWSGLITAATVYSNATVTAVTGVGGTTGTITMTATPMTDIDGYEVRGVWQNGDCAVLETAPAELNIIVKPIVTGPTTPSAVCIGQAINLTSSAAAPIAPTTQSIQWQISSTSGGPWTNLVDGVAGNGLVAGATAANLTLTPSTLGWNAQWVRVVYTNSEGGTDCVTESAAVELEVLATPEFVAIADQTVCETSNLVVTAVDGNPVSWSGNVEWYYNTSASMAGATQMFDGNVYNGSTVNISGASDATITVNATTLAWDGYYILVYNDNGSCDAFEAFEVNVDELPVVVTNPVDDDVCEFGDLQYTVDFTPVATTVTWEFWNGVVWADVVDGVSLTANAFNVPTITTIGGTTTLDVANVNIAINGWDVRVALDNGVCGTVNSTSANMGIFTVPTTPNPIGAQNILSHKFDVTYPADANALSWDIQVSEDAAFTLPLIFETTGVGPSPFTGMTDCILDPASTYYFRVRAVNACGVSGWSTPSNLVTLDPTVTNMAWLGGFDGDFGTGDLGTPTASQTLRVTYYQLDADIEMTIPADFEAFIGGNWVNGAQNLGLTLYLGTSGLPLNRDILVRMNAANCGVIDEDITIASNELCVGNTGIAVPSIAVEGFGKVPQPTIQASAVYFTANDDTEFDFTWTNGNGNGRLVTIVEDGATPWSPSDFTDYSGIASTTLALGNEITTGNWIVAAGSVSGPLTVDGLTAGVVYYAYVFEFNECASGTEDYLLPGAVGQVYQLAFYTNEPSTPMNGIPNQTSGVAFRQSDNTTALAIEVMLFDRSNSPIANPFAGFGVSIAGDPALGTVTVNSGSTTIANGDASTAPAAMSITWTYPNGILNANLVASTAQAGVLPGASNDFVLNVAPPTTQAKIILWVGVPCINNTEFKWTNGDGASRLVVGRDGSLPELPSDLTDYSALANTDYSLAGIMGTDTRVLAVINGSGNTITVTGLTLNSTYYFRVFEFNGTGGLERYLTDNASFNPRSRKITCSDGNNLYNLIVENFNVVSGKGKGIVSWNTEYEQNISGFEVSRIDLTEGSNMNPTLVGTYMNAQELVAAGNTTTGQAYKYTDNTVTLEVGRTYLYQLTAVAYDGTRIDVAESEITITDDIIAGPAEFSVTPVQVINNEATFKVITNTTQDATIELYDVIGNRVAVIANGITLGVGANEFSCPVDKLVNGTYIISVNGKDVSAIQKFQIAR
jgi:hypothetical protein